MPSHISPEARNVLRTLVKHGSPLWDIVVSEAPNDTYSDVLCLSTEVDVNRGTVAFSIVFLFGSCIFAVLWAWLHFDVHVASTMWCCFVLCMGMTIPWLVLGSDEKRSTCDTTRRSGKLHDKKGTFCMMIEGVSLHSGRQLRAMRPTCDVRKAEILLLLEERSPWLTLGFSGESVR